MFLGQRCQRSYQVTDFQVLDLAGRAGQGRLVFAPIDGGALTGSATDLTDIFVVEDPEEPRSQVRSHFPELKLPERPRQAFLDEVVGVDGVMRQTARKSPKIGKNALDVAMQYGLSGIDSFIKADGAAGR